MGATIPGTNAPLRFDRYEVTGAIGDTFTVLPIVVAVAVLTDLSLAVMLIWFGVFQIVWGLYYGVPISIEPMKAFAALVLAGTITTGELLLAGLLLGVVLLVLGATSTLSVLGRHLGEPVVRGVQFGVALVLLETGVRLGIGDLRTAAIAIGVASVVIVVGYWRLSALCVLLVGGIVAGLQVGVPAPSFPTTDSILLVTDANLSVAVLDATVAQIAMTIGNAALAASVLLSDYFDRDISPDQLSNSMGAMNLLAIPFGGFPMCHGSGGIAGTYLFGGRTAGANVLLGVGYIVVALLAVGIVAAFPLAMLGVILVVVAFGLARTSLERTSSYPLVIAIGVFGLLVNLGIAFALGSVAYLLLERTRKPVNPHR